MVGSHGERSALTVPQLPLLGQQQHVHVVVLLQGGGEQRPLAAEQEHQGQGEVGRGVPVAHHLEQRGVLDVAAVPVVWGGERGGCLTFVLCVGEDKGRCLSET